MSNENEISAIVKKIETPLSDKDLKRAFNYNINIYTTKQLQQFPNLEAVLNPFGKVVLLYEWEKNQGHWVGLHYTDEDRIEFFDPYGIKPDDQKSYIPKKFWSGNHLSWLLYDAAERGWKIEYNQYHFQTEEISGVSTCGRWVTLRLKLNNLTLDEFAALFLQKEQILNDIVVTELTYPIFKK